MKRVKSTMNMDQLPGGLIPRMIGWLFENPEKTLQMERGEKKKDH